MLGCPWHKDYIHRVAEHECRQGRSSRPLLVALADRLRRGNTVCLDVPQFRTTIYQAHTRLSRPQEINLRFLRPSRLSYNILHDSVRHKSETHTRHTNRVFRRLLPRIRHRPDTLWPQIPQSMAKRIQNCLVCFFMDNKWC